MAQNSANILIGNALVYIDDYVAAGSEVGSPTEVGHTKAATTFTPAFTDYEIKSEQAFSTIKRVPTDFSATVKIPVMEVTLETMLKALRQPSGNISGDGSASDKVLRVGVPQEVYYQVRISGPGLGDGGTRDIFIWKGIVTEVDELGVGKDQEQLLAMTIQAVYDDSVGTADKIMKIVDNMS